MLQKLNEIIVFNISEINKNLQYAVCILEEKSIQARVLPN